MPKYILRIACSEMQTTEHIDGAFVKSLDVDLLCSFLTFSTNKSFDLFFRCGDNFFDASRVNSTVDDKLFEGLSCDLAPHWIKAAYDDNSRGVVDNEIATRHLLERANISSFAPDDSTFHVVAGDVNCAGTALGCLSGRIALHSDQ